VPVTGGNVSFYNQTGATAINPTPVIGVLGVVDDVARRTPIGFPAAGLAVLLLGTTRDEFGGSEWAHEVHGHLGGRPPAVDLAAERALADVLVDLAGTTLRAAHDLSDGGLAQVLVESCLRYDVGAKVSVDGDAFVALFAESAARAVVAVDESDTERVLAACSSAGVPVARLGTTGGDALVVDGEFSIGLDELRATYEGTLPALVG